MARVGAIGHHAVFETLVGAPQATSPNEQALITGLQLSTELVVCMRKFDGKVMSTMSLVFFAGQVPWKTATPAPLIA